MNNETLQPKEVLVSGQFELDSQKTVLNDEHISLLINSRKKLLESIKDRISLKSYYAIEEKIAEEEIRLKEILDNKRGRQKKLSRYTFILDPKFFEQAFLP